MESEKTPSEPVRLEVEVLIDEIEEEHDLEEKEAGRGSDEPEET